ncbi:hypothetical protein, partial [Mesorhizobium sp.]|uniref:hypothetical protein n=1 Tax=Mesorhizobium sp. TaxID=1871066 RepID=UPI00257C5DE3
TSFASDTSGFALAASPLAAYQVTAAAQASAAMDTPTRPRFNLLWNAAVMLSHIHAAAGAGMGATAGYDPWLETGPDALA